jgi:hypothetical protein
MIFLRTSPAAGGLFPLTSLSFCPYLGVLLSTVGPLS